MKAPLSNPPLGPPHLIEVKVADIHQLFNSMDPSPFHERDLDEDAEQFIVSWAQEHPHSAPLKLLVHLGKAPEGVTNPQAMIAESVRHYFDYRADMTRRQLRQLMKQGRASLLIGLAFLAVCNLIAGFLPITESSWPGFLRQGLAIIGWVAMWRPLEIYLYQWWPVLALERVFCNLSKMQVEVEQPP
jgi:hypothetical protein